MKIKLSKSRITKSEKNAVRKVLNNEFLGMGKEVLNFETKLSKFLKSPVACVVNGTAAIQLALQSIGIGENDEVLVPSLTFLSTFQAVSSNNATPIPCDVIEEDLTLDPVDMENKITNKTKAVIPVHYSGGFKNLKKIYNIAKKYKLRVVEDAAHAFGSRIGQSLVGSYGDIICFSFDGIKNITSGEGGCVVTRNKKVINNIKVIRNLGIKSKNISGYHYQRNNDFDVNVLGWRYHMSDLMAAIGIEQLKRFNSIANKRQKLCKEYDVLLRDVKSVRTIDHDYDLIVPHIYVIVVKTKNIRNRLMNSLRAHGVETGVHYKPNHLLKYYSVNCRYKLPVTEKMYNRILTLPLHEGLLVKDVKEIVNHLKVFLG